jgi:hypothetical protein
MDIETTAANDSIGNDLLYGATAIGDFLGVGEKRVFYLAARKILPIGHLGANLIASKTALRERYEQITRGTAEPPPAQTTGRTTKPPAPRRGRARRKRADPSATEAASS